MMQVYEKSLSTIQVVDGQLVRKVKVVKVWLEANLLSQKQLGRQFEKRHCKRDRPGGDRSRTN